MRIKIKKSTSSRRANRLKKKVRIRKTVAGTEERPRLCVFKSLKHFYAQVIDDNSGRTLVSASTLEENLQGKGGKEAAKRVGEEVAKRLLSKNINTVVFDRNGYIYHGGIKTLADAAREAGLKF